MVTRDGFAFIYFQSQYDTTLFFLFRTYSYDACVRRPGSSRGAWSSWYLQVVSLHVIMDLYDISASITLFCFLLLPYG